MKALFLSVVIIQLLIIILTKAEYEFGDLISFPRKCLCITGIPTYKHYALYVDSEYPGEGDIIHRTGNITHNDIEFGWLQDQGNHQKETIPGFPKPEKKDIKDRIEAVLQKCDTYKLRSNNCEHLATYLQTGRGVAKQRGTIASIYYWFFPCKQVKDCSAWNEYVTKKIKEEEENERKCSSCSKRGG